jgi:hypothetical protein
MIMNCYITSIYARVEEKELAIPVDRAASENTGRSG